MMQIGDIVNAVICLHLTALMGVILTTGGTLSLFVKHGFCITTDSDSDSDGMWSKSHLASCCLNISFAVLLYILLQKYNDKLSQLARGPLMINIPAIVLHGLSHLLLSLFEIGDTDSDTILDKTVYTFFYNEFSFATFFVIIDILIIIWGILLYGILVQDNSENIDKSVKDRTDSTVIALAAVFTGLQVFVVPMRHINNYTLLLLLITSAAHGIFENGKSKYYNVATLSINLPVSLCMWMETVGCEKYLVHLGGHLWFDIGFIFSILFYFFCVFLLETTDDNNSAGRFTKIVHIIARGGFPKPKLT